MARLFNGTSDIITTPRVAQRLTTNFTISAWINCTDFTAERGIFQNGLTNTNGYGLCVRQTTGLLSFPEDGLGFTDSSYTVTAGVWTQVAITLIAVGSGGPNNTVNYANGALINTHVFVGNPLTPGTQCTIGRIETNMFFKGGIADVGIWNVPLSAAEIALLGDGARPYQIRPQNLTGCWLLDGYTGTSDISFGGFGTNRGALTGTTFIPGPPLISAGVNPYALIVPGDMAVFEAPLPAPVFPGTGWVEVDW